jgi:hypothetical protein
MLYSHLPSFIFTLQEFSNEVLSLIDAIGRIYNYEQARVKRGPWWRRLFRTLRRGVGRCTTRCQRRNSTGRQNNYPSLRRTLCRCFHLSIVRIILSHCVPAAYIIPEHRRPNSSFPKVRPHAPNTMQTPPRNDLPLVGRIKQTVWEVGKRLAERDTKYAFKVGMAIAMLASPAFFDATRPMFVDNYGDWALVSVSCFLVSFVPC